MIRLCREELATLDWERLDALPDRMIAQTRPWLAFVAETQRATPVVARVEADGEPAGYFTGLRVRRFGLPILGSPFPGWSTPYMGFNLMRPLPRGELLAALERFAFRELGCVHLELLDRRLAAPEAAELGYAHRVLRTFEIDLTQSEDALFDAMDSACRRCIRKAAKSGVTIEQATDAGFAEDYYAQLGDVFAKQSLVPTYDLARVKALLRALLPGGQLLLLRARDAEGRCIATGIFPAFNRTMHFWGGASWRAHQHLRPNEALQWHAMRYWRERGIQAYDMGGGGEYKRKYGGYEIGVPWLRASRFAGLAQARDWAQRAVKLMQRQAGARLAAGGSP